MPDLPVHVVRFDAWVDPAFDARLGREPGVVLTVHPMPVTPEAALAALAGAHVYPVSAARDELPAHCRVGPELLTQCPSLLCASSYGAGYDPIDVAACTIPTTRPTTSATPRTIQRSTRQRCACG